MASPKPRKKKVRLLLLLLLSRSVSAIDADETENAALEDLMHKAKNCIDSAPADTSNWSEEENDVFQGVEEVEQALTPNATSPTLSAATSTLSANVTTWENSL